MPSTGLSINSTRWRKSQGIWRSQEITQTKAYKHKKKRKTKHTVQEFGDKSSSPTNRQLECQKEKRKDRVEEIFVEIII